MPRVKKVLDDEAAVEAGLVAEAPVKPQAKVKKSDPFAGLAFEDCLPYTNDDDLPMDDVHYFETKNGNGQKVTNRKIYCGEPRFYLEQNVKAGGDWWNLIGRYRNGKGVGQKNIRTFKPKDLNRMGNIPAVLADQIKYDNKWLKFLRDERKLPVEVKRSVSM